MAEDPHQSEEQPGPEQFIYNTEFEELETSNDTSGEEAVEEERIIIPIWLYNQQKWAQAKMDKINEIQSLWMNIKNNKQAKVKGNRLSFRYLFKKLKR